MERNQQVKRGGASGGGASSQTPTCGRQLDRPHDRGTVVCTRSCPHGGSKKDPVTRPLQDPSETVQGVASGACDVLLTASIIVLRWAEGMPKNCWHLTQMGVAKQKIPSLSESGDNGNRFPPDASSVLVQRCDFIVFVSPHSRRTVTPYVTWF